MFERVVAVAGLTAAVMAVLTLVLGVLYVGASLDMLADPRPMLAFSTQQSEALRWANATSLVGYGALLLPVAFFVAARLHSLASAAGAAGPGRGRRLRDVCWHQRGHAAVGLAGLFTGLPARGTCRSAPRLRWRSRRSRMRPRSAFRRWRTCSAAPGGC